MRCRPAARSSTAYLASSTPLVVSAMSSTPGDGRQVADEIGEIRPQQRLAAGEAQLAHPEPHEQARQAHDLIERQALVRAEEAVAVVERLPRHAVRAAEVAPVHDRDPQVAHRPCRACRAAASPGMGTITSGEVICRPSLPSMHSGHETLWGRYWGRGAAHESVRAGEGGEIAGAVRRPRHGPGSAPVVDLDAHGHEKRRGAARR